MAVEDPSQIEWIPWSELSDHFVDLWTGDEPEHMEITGQTGSGKTYFLLKALQDRAKKTNDREILVVTKKSDKVFDLLGWPVTDKWSDVRSYRQVIYWPNTELIGTERKAYHEPKLFDLFARLWTPESNCVVAVDEIGYVEKLSARVRDLVGMYWREGRSNGITFAALKQRPIGVLRDQHSETRWKAVFPPADRGDLPRFADLLGRKKDWEPVLEQLGQHEFVLHYSGQRDEIEVPSVVTWIDEPVRPVRAQVEQRKQPLPTYRRSK